MVKRVREALPGIQAQLPPELKMELLFDQSVFVRAAVEGVLKEGAIAAGLTALMILLFLGSWRSTLIVATSIPLSILTSVIVLWALGQSLNTMTLGGMALAVGILVDDATVEIENVHRNFGHEEAAPPGDPGRGRPDRGAGVRLDAGHLHRLRAGGVPDRAGRLPVLRRWPWRSSSPCWPPTSCRAPWCRRWCCTCCRRKSHAVRRAAEHEHDRLTAAAVRIWRVPSRASTAASSGCGWPTRGCSAGPSTTASSRSAVLLGFALRLAGCCAPRIGQDFFPRVDAGQFRLHVRAPAGTRIEETERIFGQVEDAIREIVPDSERAMILDNMGLTQSFTIMAYVDNGTVSDADGEILVSLKPDHRPTADYVARLRDELPRRFPDCTFFFEPADITSQILDFGLPAPIDVQVVGVNRDGNLAVAQKLRQEIAKVPGIADVHLHQITDQPDLQLDVDRIMASELGLTQQDVAGSVLVSLSSTTQVSPNFWVNPHNRVNYRVAVQTPEYRIHSVDTLMNTPIINGQTASAVDRPPPATGRSTADARRQPPQLLEQPGGPAPRHRRRRTSTTTTSSRSSTSTPTCRAATWRRSRPTCRRSWTRSGRNCRAAARS